MGMDCVCCLLKDIGCSSEEVERFLEMERTGDRAGQIGLLTCRRCTLLERMHSVQKQIDEIDCLLYKIRKENGKNEKNEKGFDCCDKSKKRQETV